MSRLYAFDLAVDSEKAGNFVHLDSQEVYNPNSQTWEDPKGNRAYDSIQAKSLTTTGACQPNGAGCDFDSQKETSSFLGIVYDWSL